MCLQVAFLSEIYICADVYCHEKAEIALDNLHGPTLTLKTLKTTPLALS